MSITIADPALLAPLRLAADVVELKDPDGKRLIGSQRSYA